MKNQKGSILVGVIALSLVMSLAAGGFIILSTNTAKDGLISASDLQLQYAAESGMHMAIRWTRAYDKGKINDSTWAKNFVLTRGPGGFDTLNGKLVKVTFGYEGQGVHTINSLATGPSGHPILQISQVIDSATDGPGGVSPLVSTPVLSSWTQVAFP